MHDRDHRSSRWPLAALLAVAALWPAPAAAAAGQITYAGCLNNDGTENCIDLPGKPLDRAIGVAVSPDGASVYVASSTSASISHLFRDRADGRLAWDGCLNNDGLENCGDLPGKPLDRATGVAVSPDGLSIYVTSGSSGGSIAHFFRDDPGGQIYYDGCLANDGSQGCVDLPGTAPILDPRAVEVSPDGRSVYMASGGGSVAHFARRSEGQISWAGCWANDAFEGCSDLPGAPLQGAGDVALSPDGRFVYVASASSESISSLSRDPDTGHLAWDGCLNDDGSENCGSLPGSPLDGATGVAISPDGRSVYVASSTSDSISHLFRNPANGQLSWDGCLAGDTLQSCADLPGAPLDGAHAVAVSPDGRSVYVASEQTGSISHLFRAPADGRLTWDGCLNGHGTESCGDLPGAPLDGAAGVAVSADGRSVYVASVESGSIARFSRAPAAPAPSPGPPAAVDTVGPRISGVAFSGRRFRYTLSEPATVTVAIERARPGRRAAGRCRKPSRRLRSRPACTRWTSAAGKLTRTGISGRNRLAFTGRAGAYRARFSATDAAGNRSATTTLRFRIAR